MPAPTGQRTAYKLSACSILNCASLPIYMGWNCWRHHTKEEKAQILEKILSEFRSKRELRNVCLEGVEFRGRDLHGARFVRCKFTRASFEEANLSDTTFENCQLDATSFFGANLVRSRLVDCTLRNANLVAANLTAAVLSRSNLTNAQFHRANWTEGLAKHSDMRNTVLVNTQLQGANFGKAKLQSALFDEAEARGAQFRGANLTSATFVGATLTHAVMKGAELSKADLTGAKCDFANFRGAILAHTHLEKACLKGCQFDGGALRRSYLKQTDVTGLDTQRLGISGEDVYEESGIRYVRKHSPKEKLSLINVLVDLPLLLRSYYVREQVVRGRAMPWCSCLLLSVLAFFVAESLIPGLGGASFFVSFFGTYVLFRRGVPAGNGVGQRVFLWSIHNYIRNGARRQEMVGG